jgi:hypothetical protein
MDSRRLSTNSNTFGMGAGSDADAEMEESSPTEPIITFKDFSDKFAEEQ